MSLDPLSNRWTALQSVQSIRSNPLYDRIRPLAERVLAGRTTYRDAENLVSSGNTIDESGNRVSLPADASSDEAKHVLRNAIYLGLLSAAADSAVSYDEFQEMVNRVRNVGIVPSFRADALLSLKRANEILSNPTIEGGFSRIIDNYNFLYERVNEGQLSKEDLDNYVSRLVDQVRNRLERSYKDKTAYDALMALQTLLPSNQNLSELQEEVVRNALSDYRTVINDEIMRTERELKKVRDSAEFEVKRDKVLSQAENRIRRRLRQDGVPDEVIDAVVNDYLSRVGTIEHDISRDVNWVLKKGDLDAVSKKINELTERYQRIARSSDDVERYKKRLWSEVLRSRLEKDVENISRHMADVVSDMSEVDSTLGLEIEMLRNNLSEHGVPSDLLDSYVNNVKNRAKEIVVKELERKRDRLVQDFINDAISAGLPPEEAAKLASERFGVSLTEANAIASMTAGLSDVLGKKEVSVDFLEPYEIIRGIMISDGKEREVYEKLLVKALKKKVSDEKGARELIKEWVDEMYEKSGIEIEPERKKETVDWIMRLKPIWEEFGEKFTPREQPKEEKKEEKKQPVPKPENVPPSGPEEGSAGGVARSGVSVKAPTFPRATKNPDMFVDFVIWVNKHDDAFWHYVPNLDAFRDFLYDLTLTAPKVVRRMDRYSWRQFLTKLYVAARDYFDNDYYSILYLRSLDPDVEEYYKHPEKLYPTASEISSIEQMLEFQQDKNVVYDMPTATVVPIKLAAEKLKQARQLYLKMTNVNEQNPEVKKKAANDYRALLQEYPWLKKMLERPEFAAIVSDPNAGLNLWQRGVRWLARKMGLQVVREGTFLVVPKKVDMKTTKVKLPVLPPPEKEVRVSVEVPPKVALAAITATTPTPYVPQGAQQVALPNQRTFNIAPVQQPPVIARNVNFEELPLPREPAKPSASPTLRRLRTLDRVMEKMEKASTSLPQKVLRMGGFYLPDSPSRRKYPLKENGWQLVKVQNFDRPERDFFALYRSEPYSLDNGTYVTEIAVVRPARMNYFVEVRRIKLDGEDAGKVSETLSPQLNVRDTEKKLLDLLNARPHEIVIT